MIQSTRPAAATGILMLNMGGPQTLAEVKPFLLNLFADRDLMRLPLQDWLGRLIAERRAPKVARQYAEIGGGSPIYHWTRRQGDQMAAALDQISPQTAPHRAYIAFRYAPPFAVDALQAIQADGVERVVVFTQYPHFSHTTTGSSLNDLWRAADRLGVKGSLNWRVIDHWPLHPGLIQTWAAAIRTALESIPPAARDQTLLLFSAHSLPLKSIQAGDPYPLEINATAYAVMQQLKVPNDAVVCYQSKVGPLKWLGPSTEAVLRQAARDGRPGVLLIPIAFTSDHIETLHELDIEYASLAQRLGIGCFRRAPAPNDAPVFIRALADLVAAQLAEADPPQPALV
jgi:ferrochelatase